MADNPTPLAAALDAVGDRWTLLIVESLLDGPRRFGDLQDELSRIAPNVLSQRLRRLEGEGLVVAQPYSERPQRFVYELTASGHELAGALRLLADWGARHREAGEAPRHDVCGTPVEARWWCPDLRASGRRRGGRRPALRLALKLALRPASGLVPTATFRRSWRTSPHAVWSPDGLRAGRVAPLAGRTTPFTGAGG